MEMPRSAQCLRSTCQQEPSRYRVVGPARRAAPPVVFVHGFLVDGRLWDGVAERLAADGVRCYLPDLPLGSHRDRRSTPDADRSPRGIARLIIEFLEALDLDDVTLVGNDTGGAICQFLLDTDAHADRPRSCSPTATRSTTSRRRRSSRCSRPASAPARCASCSSPTRSDDVRHSPARLRPARAQARPRASRARWVEPILDDPAIAEDAAALCAASTPRSCSTSRRGCTRSTGPCASSGARRDRFFKPEFGRRLAELFPRGTYVGIPGALTFLSARRAGPRRRRRSFRPRRSVNA